MNDTRLTLRIDRSLKSTLRETAAARDESASEIARAALAFFLEEDCSAGTRPAALARREGREIRALLEDRENEGQRGLLNQTARRHFGEFATEE